MLELWKTYHESKGHQCDYITLCQSPLSVDNGICLHLPFLADSLRLVQLRKMYYKMVKGKIEENQIKDGYPPIWIPNSIFESTIY